MRAIRHAALTALLAATATACADSTGPVSQPQFLLDDAFASVLFGFHNTMNSYDPGTSGGMHPWIPASHASMGGRGPGASRMMGGSPSGGMQMGARDPGGHHGAGPGGGMMGGGLGGPFHGGFLSAGGFVLPPSCAFDAASSRVVCPDTTRNGLTISRSAAYTTAAGVPQQAFDAATTNAVNVRIAVSGAMVRHDNAATTVQHASDRTIAGLAPGSTRRTINGTSAGSESTSGRNRDGVEFTAQRVMSDTVHDVVLPVRSDSSQAYPVSGTITRSMRATVTAAGGAPVTTFRREVITYDGSSTAQLVITYNDVTRTCTLPLPFGRPTCQ